MANLTSNSSGLAYTSPMVSTTAAPAIEFQSDKEPIASLKVLRAVEAAVYAYIQAQRALGQTTVNTNDVARALSLTHAQVVYAMHRLAGKGVKVPK